MSSKSRLILGIDEAGYGPNIGPLVVGCTAWMVDKESVNASGSESADDSLLDRLAPAFMAKPVGPKIKHIPLGDSKALYKSGTSLDSLSLGVRYWMKQIQAEPKDFQSAIELIALPSVDSLSRLPWYQSQHFIHAGSEQLMSIEKLIPASLVQAAGERSRQAGLQLVGLKAVVIDEKHFNQEIMRLGNKANLLSYVSMRLARDCLELYTGQQIREIDSIQVFCDKHGGRNRYQSILMDTMPELWFKPVHESLARSHYRARWHDCDLDWSFLAKGDRLLAPALASMTAKWLREGLMTRLNDFWKKHVPGLKPTAGYPVDAQRFRSTIQPVATRLDLPISDWWRSR